MVGSAERVCPWCGAPPGGVFCASCGRNLADVERLPTRAEWEQRSGATPPAPDGPAPAATTPPPYAAGATAGELTQRFLAAMARAGNPGTKKFRWTKPKAFERAGKAQCWIVVPVDRDDVGPRKGHYVPGIALTTDGSYRQLDSQLRGHGQRTFPVYEHFVGREEIPPPPPAEIAPRLAALLAEHGIEDAAA